MAHLLHIDSSPRGERSHSRRLSREFVEQWKQNHPGDIVTYRDVGRNPVPHNHSNYKAQSNPNVLKLRRVISNRLGASLALDIARFVAKK
ncbi:MAG: NAD(P)H-dependent oxidoreductase [Phormidium sp.]